MRKKKEKNLTKIQRKLEKKSSIRIKGLKSPNRKGAVKSK